MTSARRAGIVTVVVLLAVLAVAQGAVSRSNPGTSSRAAVVTVHPSKVLVLIEENHSYTQMKAGMPYLFGLSKKYGYATNWAAITHPSLPNYLAISGGTTFGITDDKAPQAHYGEVGSARSVFDQAINAGKTAKTYAESMPTNDNCHLLDYPTTGASYAVRHNPWTYYSASRTRCKTFDVPTTSFAADAKANRLPNVGFVIPNLCDDAHNCSLATADNWLKANLPAVLASSDFTSGKLAVVVTADEDDRKSGNKVLTSVLSPRLAGKVVTTALTHYSLTRYIAQVLGVAPLQNGATAPDMKSAFGL
jgi:hypothetical protein